MVEVRALGARSSHNDRRETIGKQQGAYGTHVRNNEKLREGARHRVSYSSDSGSFLLSDPAPSRCNNLHQGINWHGAPVQAVCSVGNYQTRLGGTGEDAETW